MHHPLWHKIPLVRLLVPFVCGIVISMHLTIPFPIIVGCFLVLFVSSVLLQLWVKQYALRWFFGVSICVCFFAAGWAIHVFQQTLRNDKHYSFFSNAKYVLVHVETKPMAKLSGYRMTGNVIAVIDSAGNAFETMGKLMVNIRKDDTLTMPEYGDVFVIPAKKMSEVSGPKNPGEFDYKQYLARKQVYFQANVKASEVLLTGENRGDRIQQWVYRVQDYMKHILAQNIGSQNETGVAQALLYGYDKDIDDETKQAYSNTGTLHVLAVSGMHVGIIYLVLGLLLAPLAKSKHGKFTKQCIILLLLWVYSFICGMSPSILRATVMFTFIIIAGLMDEKSSVYNTLAASVFVLLCFDANLIVNVGFQLSYLAVLGILFFHPYIFNLYTASNWFVFQVWSVVSVSLAAQLVTFPIGLLYFHQFPNCFLLSNLLIIPLTSLILYLGIGLLAVSWITFPAWILGKLLYYLILFTNELAKTIEHIPYAYVNGIFISGLQSVLLYAMIVLLTFFLIRKQSLFLKSALCCAIVFCVLMVHAWFLRQQQSQLVVYHIPKHNAIQWIQGNNAVLFADSILLADTGKLKFHVLPHAIQRGIQHQQLCTLKSQRWETVVMDNHTIVFAGTGKPPAVACDVLIVPLKLKLESVLENIDARSIILTTAVKPADAAVMMEEGRRKKIDVKYVGDNGAIQLSLPK